RGGRRRTIAVQRVDGAVAVVVDAVRAELDRLWLRGVAADAERRVAGAHAGPGAERAAGVAGLAGEAFVDLAVAVVVLAVAQRFGGRGHAHARAVRVAARREARARGVIE